MRSPPSRRAAAPTVGRAAERAARHRPRPRLARTRRFPPTRAFAHDILPGVRADAGDRQGGAALDRTGQGLACAHRARRRRQGPRAATPSLAKLSGEQIPVFKQTEAFNKCLTKVIYPGRQHQAPGRRHHFGRRKLQGVLVQPRGPRGHRPELRRQRHLRASSWSATAARRCVSSRRRRSVGAKPASGLKLLARSPLPPQGTRPAFPAEEPPYKPLVPCYTQALPEFNGPLSQGPADGSG